MKIKLKTEDDAKAVVKRAFFLAYNACGRALGMGLLQARPNVTEDELYDAIIGNHDYTFPGCDPTKQDETDLYADYVFGRMMKLGIQRNGCEVEIPDRDEYDPEYHDFAHKYPNATELLTAAVKDLSLTFTLQLSDA